MQTTKPRGPQLVRPGPIGLGIRVLLGATVLYWFAALLAKWSGFVERDPIESGRLYTLFTIWWLPEVFAVSFPVAILTRSPGCELGALPWLLGGREGEAAPRRGCAVGLDRLDAWEAARRR
jgi:hypothetical protein